MLIITERPVDEAGLGCACDTSQTTIDYPAMQARLTLTEKRNGTMEGCWAAKVIDEDIVCVCVATAAMISPFAG